MPIDGQSETPREDGQSPEISILDSLRETTPEAERGVAERQAEQYERALLRLMRRTDSNPELVNAMRDFVAALEWHSTHDDETEQLTPDRLERLTNFFLTQIDTLSKL
jgi:hypothetical protein